MVIRSNISAVIRRLRLYQDGLPEVARAAVAPAFWKPRLEEVALKTIRAQWALERNVALREAYEALTPKLVGSIVGLASETGAVYAMGLAGGEMAGTLAGKATGSFANAAGEGYATEARAFNQGEAPLKSARHLAWHEANLERVRQTIRDFVALEKHWDARDAGKSADEVSERLMEIMGVGTKREVTPEMEEAAGKLTQAIQSWLDGEGDAPPPSQPGQANRALTQTSLAGFGGPAKVSRAVVRSWLEAVLLAWAQYVQASLPGRLKVELGKLRRRTREGLL